jgi:hypothetical protein
MDELHRITDKLFTEIDHLDDALGDCENLTEAQITLALAAAKRVRRDSTLTVKLLASLRDNATA